MIILASKSPRRKALLRRLGLKFRVSPSSASEKTSLRRPSAIVRSLALRKAESVAARFPEYPVVGADTIVVCKGRILGKPKDRSHAFKMLELQNGCWQSVYTGVAVVFRGKKFCGYEVSRCKARKFPPEKLKKLAGKHGDKAGGYAVQDAGDPFIEKIVGSRDNVVGLPCGLLKKLLRRCGYDIISL